MLDVGIAIGIETGRLSLDSIPIPITPVRWHSYTVSQSERNSDICYNYKKLTERVVGESGQGAIIVGQNRSFEPI